MIIMPIEPYYDKLQEHYQANRKKIKVDFWEWIQRDYKGYQVYVVSNPTAVGEKEGCGLMFGEEQEASMFALLW
jgi:hypothetical protein